MDNEAMDSIEFNSKEQEILHKLLFAPDNMPEVQERQIHNIRIRAKDIWGFTPEEINSLENKIRVILKAK